MVKYEDKDICSKCGGYCCKKCGCDYSAKDFDSLNYKDLFDKLSEGDISIVSTLIFSKLKDGRKIVSPFLYLRARNNNRDIVDLLSFKNTCKMLKKDGCFYDADNRPSGGINLIPKENDMCYPLVSQKELVDTWIPYQKVLSRIVKRLTGLSVDEKFKSDVVSLLTDILNENFEGISRDEIEDIKGLIPHLIETCPDEYRDALSKFSKKNVLKK